jgi:hypothetical protein
LLTLEQHLRERSTAKLAKGITHNVPLIAKFNPSRHCKGEPLWAAFAAHLTKKFIRGQNFRERLKGHVRVFLCPYRWRRGWVDILKTGTAFLIGTGLLFSLLALRPHSRKTRLLQFANTVQSANPDRRLSLLKACFKDLPRIVEAYAKDKMIVVFIEDLDRCAVPQAMELMQAINLLISTELKSVVIVVGMGRIAGAVAIESADELRNRARCISIVS